MDSTFYSLLMFPIAPLLTFSLACLVGAALLGLSATLDERRACKRRGEEIPDDISFRNTMSCMFAMARGMRAARRDTIGDMGSQGTDARDVVIPAMAAGAAMMHEHDEH